MYLTLKPDSIQSIQTEQFINDQLQYARFLKSSTLAQLELMRLESFYASQKLNHCGTDERTLKLLSECAQAQTQLMQLLEQYCQIERLLLQYRVSAAAEHESIEAELRQRLKAVLSLELLLA